MLALDPLVDNTETNLETVYKKLIPECEEVRIATGYFYLWVRPLQGRPD